MQQVEGGLKRMEYGGGGTPTRLVCGFVGTEMRRHPLVDALPTAFALDINGQACADWVGASFRYAAQEVASGRAGSETILAKLSELLFVEAVRHYAETLPPDRKGWFAAFRDPAVGRALALMHARVAHDWTTDELAAEVNLSRSAFAERFSQLVGAPPITYLRTGECSSPPPACATRLGRLDRSRPTWATSRKPRSLAHSSGPPVWRRASIGAQVRLNSR